MAENVDDFIAGWASGATALLATQPIDLVLTRVQAGLPISQQLREAQPTLRGLPGLWRGISPLLASVPVNNALLFYGYGAGVRAAERESQSNADGEARLLPVFIGGCAGGFVQSFLQSPVELVKVRLQLAASGAPARSPGELAAELIRTAPAGFFSRGLSATLLRDVIPHGVWFSTYEWAKRRLAARKAAAQTDASASASREAPAPRLSTTDSLAAGSLAAAVAWLVGYPADVLKTRCQMAGGHESTASAARAVYAEGGLPAFYRGLGLKLLRAVPMSAVNFLAYEEAMAAILRLRRTFGTADEPSSKAP